MQRGEHDLLSFLRPDTLIGALAYLVQFILIAMILSRVLRTAVHAAMTRKGHLDRTTVSFLLQMGSALIWVVLTNSIPASQVTINLNTTFATLELHLSAPDIKGREALRGALLAQLSTRFAAAKIGGTGAVAPAFS